jgi:hypothetical protein
MNAEREDFLSRWSRRKLEARREEEAATSPLPAQEAEAPPPEAASDVAQDAPDLTPEEIAALPKIEEITAETDITVFLRKGVPEMLKNAALRRMWLLDPKIRDFVGDARDYAYDWNVPGGVPGNGPLLPTDDVEAMVRQVFGDKPAAPAALSQMRQPPSSPEIVHKGDGESKDPSDVDAAQPGGEAAPAVARAGDPVELPALPSEPVRLTGQDHVAPPLDTEPQPLPQSRSRRHGSAKPL